MGRCQGGKKRGVGERQRTSDHEIASHPCRAAAEVDEKAECSSRSDVWAVAGDRADEGAVRTPKDAAAFITVGWEHQNAAVTGGDLLEHCVQPGRVALCVMALRINVCVGTDTDVGL